MTADEVKHQLAAVADAGRAKTNAWFFKSEPGEYGAGDRFIGVSVPNQRQVAKASRDLSHGELAKLFASPYHEHRLTACFIGVYQYQAAKKSGQETAVYEFYLGQLRSDRVNNWDMVDTSVPQIIGDYLLERPRDLLYQLAQTDNLWQQRAAIMATQAFIKQADYGDTLKLAELLLNHSHDLIQKAVGWMLREVGNRDRAVEEEFLRVHYQAMPRTMLRYAIEKFPSDLRRDYLEGKVKPA